MITPTRHAIRAILQRKAPFPPTTAVTAVTTALTNTAPRNNQITRHYRGDSGDMTPRKNIQNNDAIAAREERLAAKAASKYDEIFEKHIKLPTLDTIPPSSLAPSSSSSSSSDNDDLVIRKKRLVYRAKQRGWLEVDLLLGTWANKNVHDLTMDELDEFERFVNLETIDIYNIVTLRSDVPADMKGGCGVVERIQDWARGSPLGKAEPEIYKTVKRDNNLI